MSYINEALKKAQEEKNSRYGALSGVASAVTAAGKKRGWTARWGISVALSLMIAGISLLAVLFIFFPPAADRHFFPMFAKTKEVAAGPTEKKDVPKAERPLAAKALNGEALEKSPSGSPAAEKKNFPEDKRAAGIKGLCDEAATASRKGDFSGARALYEKALKLAPENVEILNNLGVVYLAEKKREKALSLFRRAILLKQDYVDPYYNMACLYAQKNDIDQSLWYLKIAISMDRDVVNWVKKDADMKVIAASPKFKEIDGGAKN
jgi:tetratricopeptide (TPR) repeat protein